MNDICASTFTFGTVTLTCTEHLKGNPFRYDVVVHAGGWNEHAFYWTTGEQD